jgi:hypothetical protein
MEAAKLTFKLVVGVRESPSSDCSSCDRHPKRPRYKLGYRSIRETACVHASERSQGGSITRTQAGRVLHHSCSELPVCGPDTVDRSSRGVKTIRDGFLSRK